MMSWMKGLATASVMLIVAFSGCAGNSAADAYDGAVTKLDGQRLDNIQDGEGALRGTVTDDLGFPLTGAKVALVGTLHIALTQADGVFLLLNVSVGEYKLYVEAVDHAPAESPIAIISGELSEVSVVLLPTVARGPGYRPHIHDFWGDKTELVAIDGTAFEYHEPYDDTGPYSESFSRYYDTTTAGNVHPCVWTDSRDEVYFNNRLMWFDEPTQLIVPGTAQIEVIIDWSEANYPYHTDYALAWAGANTSLYDESPLITKGESFFVDVAPKDWDSSHQSFSLWELYMCLDTASDEDVPRLFVGEFTATVKLHRMEGPVPFEQAHPVFWPEDGKMIVIGETEGQKTLPESYSLSRSTYNSVFVVRPDEGALVPPGTKQLLARIEWDPTCLAAPQPFAFSLTYRPANERFWDMKNPDQMMRPQLEDQGANFREYLIQPEKVQVDQFYQSKSNWFFFINLEGDEDNWGYTSPCPNTAIPVDVTVAAYKDAEFAEG
jgi:hypothetical protein